MSKDQKKHVKNAKCLDGDKFSIETRSKYFLRSSENVCNIRNTYLKTKKKSKEDIVL